MDVPVADLAAFVPQIVNELKLSARQVIATAELLEQGGTVPFIARYRKEATGGMDEVAVIAVRDRLEQLRELTARRAAILKSLTEQGKLTDALKAQVAGAATLSALEDIYLPYRPKRRTRGTIAKEKGLEPLAQSIFEQTAADPAAAAAAFVSAEKGVEDIEAALAGARDIIAEWINEDAGARAEIRHLFASKGILKSRVITSKEADAIKYKDYFDWSEPIAKAPSHRVLAVRRGEKEGFLILEIQPDAEEAVALLERRFVKGSGPAAAQVKAAVHDSYKRLMSPSIETDVRLESKKRADEEAIRVFADNVRQLMLAAPLGQKRVLAVDPGLRTGCKIVVLDAQGKMLHHDVIFPLEPANRKDDAAAMIKFLCQRYAIEAIAVGNGTGGREAEAFCRDLGLGAGVAVVSVSESGASVYSASEVAREEFADYDLTVRGAVSIGRRLMDPLAELVKIDPK
ncbi:MAG: RNA-binding transcriptional accessory protein, partial [Planctomycetaceae bacterium]|nr:RNA-binding transcriptional accessory protein [Planctomycetaceae bacterium]